ncbi:M-phase phosphoprotein 9-like isoform 1 [Cricetulus griseus]|uniref:M-phase phosphoprotein 9-like isoform 1 n=1 Tax=Cricetulus griseus TaxID=10029 RepID=A0A061IBQ8_CRIGR|nr:M-phase phosphoprotein 9-like isoform 1 [Cricetulus griseus]
MGFFSENSKRNESALSYPESKEPKTQPDSSTFHPDCNVDSSSVSSGYGTFCILEMNTHKAKEPMEPEAASQGQRTAPAVQTHAPVGDTAAINFFAQTPEELCASLKEDVSTFPGEFEHNFLGENKISEVYSGKANSKSITSWAQKLKQNQPKQAHTEDGYSRPKPGIESNWKPPVETSNLSAAATHPCAFYLSKPTESPSSCMSDSGTGTMCGLSSLSTTFPFALALTLDPTIHMKPKEQVAGIRSHGFLNTVDDRISFSPDFVLEPSLSSHSDIDSFSQASHNASQVSGFPKYPSTMNASPVDTWKNHAFQRDSRTSSTIPSLYTITSNDTSVKTVDEENTLTVASVSVSQSQLPGTANSVPECISLTSLEDPVMLSKIRQSLKEKQARHIADLRAYYESEISSLKQKLEAKDNSAIEEWKKKNEILADRCSQLDSALNEATSRVRTLENKNNLLEIEANDLRERFNAASSASKILQERIEEMRTSNKEKDNTITRLKCRLQDLEEAFENAYKLSDDKEARLKQENKMFQDLLGEYESLGKEHGRVKDTLNTTENKLLDAHTQISDLKSANFVMAWNVSYLYSTLATSDVSRRKWLIPGAEYSIFTGQPLDTGDRKIDNQLEETLVPGYRSPPEKDSSLGRSPASLLIKKQRDTPDTPVMKALKELDEERIFKNWETQTEKEDSSCELVNPRQTEPSVNTGRSPEKCGHQRPKRQSSASQRSSSLPPSSRKASTPTKREIMLTPVTVAYSPKRSPKENLSPGFSHLLSKNEGSPVRFDILLDDLDIVPVSTLQRTNPRKQLQFLPLDDSKEKKYSEKASDNPDNHSSCPETLPNGVKKVSARQAWEKSKSVSLEQCKPLSAAPQGNDFEYTAKIRTLAETERFFDELTKEKDQIEAALSRMPSPGGRITLQTRLNQEALEDRLERINRELGSVRMTLKKFHVLRSSANL